ncbi:MAG: cytochrome ubiquinol oxidase subunit I, partial [Actinomycetota bacterium]|nr:cytochrome ubiquinol oxidase subunit I [Actinomycetota bacterium]
VAFFPMHVLGLLGMPRRVYTYAEGLGWETLNVVVTGGSFLFGLGTALTLANWIWSRTRGEPAGDNPWDADSLEWAIASPTPHYNFKAIPVVTSRHPLWDQQPLPEATSGDDDATRSLGEGGALDRETPITTGLDAAPEETMAIPRETYLPFMLALGLAVLFVGLLVEAVVIGAAGLAVAVVGLVWWTWRTEADLV